MSVYKIAEELAGQQFSQVAFVLFDNEEKGLLGSMGFARLHKKSMDDKVIINFDCVGEGEYILIGGTKATFPIAERIGSCKREEETLRIESHLKKNILLMSDDQNFKRAIQVMAFQKDAKDRFVLKNIHNNKDITLDMNNVEVIKYLIANFIRKEVGPVQGSSRFEIG